MDPLQPCTSQPMDPLQLSTSELMDTSKAATSQPMDPSQASTSQPSRIQVVPSELLVEQNGSGRPFPGLDYLRVDEEIEILEVNEVPMDEYENVAITCDVPLPETVYVDSGSDIDAFDINDEEALAEEEVGWEDLAADGDDLAADGDDNELATDGNENDLATDGDDNELAADGGMQDEEAFHWSDQYQTFRASKEKFSQDVGPKITGDTPSDIFCQLWDRPLIETIVEETNRYAKQIIDQAGESIPAGSRLNTWVETTVPEMYRLIAVIIFMGMCVRGRIDEYWSTGTLGMRDFRKIMSLGRYHLLCRFLHFVNNEHLPEQGHKRKAAKIQPIVDYLINKFQSAYSPRRQLSLDESLLLCKGRLSWVQWIRSKSAHGIKTYELCEAASGYVLNIIVYTGKDPNDQAADIGPRFLGSTAKIVLTLMANYLGKGYTLFMDHFYNSLELCRYLKRRATDVVGTLNRRRVNTPPDIKNLDERKISRGTAVSRHCGDISVTAWNDVKLVTTVSTYHNADMTQVTRSGQEMFKPKVVEEYYKYMGGVDMNDQKLSMYLLERKRGMKLYIKLFRRLLNISILNSYIIYKCSDIGRRQTLSHRQFRYKLATELCERFGGVSAVKTRVSVPKQTPSARLDRSFDHFPERTETNKRQTIKDNKHKRMRCVRCSAFKKRTMTYISCSHCKVFLCIGQCWRDYHTLETL